MPNSFKELFGRKSKESVEEIELEAVVNLRRNKEILVQLKSVKDYLKK